MGKKQAYIPALRFNWLTGLYDQTVSLTMPEKQFKLALIKQADILPGYKVLDFGCGSLTLTLLAKENEPLAEYIGVDVDEQIISIAKKKLEKESVSIAIDQYDGVTLPYPDQSFDRVITSLVFHHLTAVQKANSLKEIKRVLKPGGQLHIADWGKAANPLMRMAFYLVQLLDGFATTTENVQGKLPDYLSKAGFLNIVKTKKFNTILGTLELLKSEK